MQYTVVITIGRNMANTPMCMEDWFLFKTAVLNSLAAVEAVVLQHPRMALYPDGPDQVGVWEGQQEEAACFVAMVSNRGLPYLKSFLRRDAVKFQQQCIGFIAVPGTEHLIHAE